MVQLPEIISEKKCTSNKSKKVAINAIYDRIRKNILKGEKIQERVGLLHSDMISCYLDRAEKVEEVIV